MSFNSHLVETFAVGLTMKNICEICELKCPLRQLCRKAMVRATIENVLGAGDENF